MTTTKTYTATELTLDEKLTKLAGLRAIPESVLNKLKKYELIELAKGLVTYAKDYSKADLAKELVRLRAESISELELEALTTRESEETRQEKQSFREKTSTADKADIIIAGITKIATDYDDADNRMFAVMTYAGVQLRALENYPYAPTTIKSMLTEIGKLIEDRANNSNDDRLKLSLLRFKSAIWKLFGQTKAEIKEKEEQDRNQRLETAPKVKGTALLNEAIEVLKSIPKGAIWVTNKDLPKWTKVAVALAITTGRRSAEILATAKFKKTDENSEQSIMFSGQAKAKGANRDDRMKAFSEIPVLAHPDLILNGLAYLENKRKDIDYNPDAVNKKYSRELQREMDNWKKIGEMDGLMFKSLRAIYAEICRQNFYAGNEQSVNIYFSKILGHRDGDIDTANTYKTYEVV